MMFDSCGGSEDESVSVECDQDRFDFIPVA